MSIADRQKLTDRAKPKPLELTEKAKAQIEKLTRQLERQGVSADNAGVIAEKVAVNAEGPIALDDWMTLDASRFSEQTKATLGEQGMTADKVLADPNLAEDYAAKVIELEGMPNGNGGTDDVRGVVSGHYEKRGAGGVGIDMVVADDKGVPCPVEVKKYKQTSAAHLENRPVERLEPDVMRWRDNQKAQVHAKQQDRLTAMRPDANATWKPKVTDWQQQIVRDEARMSTNKTGELPVQQMDDLWTQDRWLKVIKTPEGRVRMADIGVDSKYLNYDRLRSSPDLPEWQDILDRRATIVISGSSGDVGKQLFLQSVRDGRSKSVVKIKV